jgi:hypothetical protein
VEPPKLARISRCRVCAKAACAIIGYVIDSTRSEVCDQLRRLIAWEISAQMGVERPIEEMPPIIADTLLDHFDVTLKPGVDLSALE